MIPQEPSAVRSPFISGPLLSFILALTSFAHLATFCQHPESSLASIVAMCCRRHVDVPFRTTPTTRIISSPAMSVPSWRDRHSACCEIKKRIISSPAISAPSWRDRHLACCEIKKGLLARPRCLRPLGATAIRLAVKYKKGLLARLRCLCPCGATAIRLAVK